MILAILMAALCNSFTSAQNNQNKRNWTFTNGAGRAANDLHIELVVGTVPVNIVTNPADGIRRAGGVFSEFPEAGSPSHHDYAGGTVAAAGSVTLQFKDNTRPRRWWWTWNGERIGDIQGSNSRDLAYVLPMEEWRDLLPSRPAGSGRTTGRIGVVSVTNTTGQPLAITVGPCFIPSDKKHQSYVVTESAPVPIAAGETASIPLQGYCADIFTSPVPAGAPLPPVSEWITAGESLPLPTPGGALPPESGWRPNPGNTGGATFPGTDIPFPYTIDSHKHPAAFGSIAMDALDRVSSAYDVLQGSIQTPFSGNPEKERETVIQQTFWIYTASLTGRDYKVEDFARNAYAQFASAAGKDEEDVSEEEKEKLQDGVDLFWSSFQATGAEAKVLAGEDKEIDYDDIEKAEDLPKPIRPAYDRYAAERALNPKMTHEEAMKKAFSSKEARNKWSDTFRKIYGK